MLILGVIVSVIILINSIFVYQNYSTAKAKTVEAKLEFKSDSIQSLICYINSSKHSLEDKNLAVWVLGRFSDERAIPFLTTLSAELTDSNGEELDYRKYICKYEVDQALFWCRHKYLNSLRLLYSNREKW